MAEQTGIDACVWRRRVATTAYVVWELPQDRQTFLHVILATAYVWMGACA